MKRILLAAAAISLMGLGCGNETEQRPAMINPTGKASNLSPEEAARSDQYQQAGARANAAMEEAAQKMREAKRGGS